MTDISPLLILYFFIISVITVITSCYDKICAKKGKRRIPESTLLSLALFGGAVAEYLTMKVIRHKTRHKKFMIGLPVIIILQVSLCLTFLYYM